MKVRIDGKEYKVGNNCDVIEVILTDSDKKFIRKMPKSFYHYLNYRNDPEVTKKVAERIEEIEKEKVAEKEKIKNEIRNSVLHMIGIFTRVKGMVK